MDARISRDDRTVLRELAGRIRDHAESPRMAERRRLWYALAARTGDRPMILAETGGVRDEILPDSACRCAAPWRALERNLREILFRIEQVGDDWVAAGRLDHNWRVTIGDYGLTATYHHTDNQGRLASHVWAPAVKDFDRDFPKLHPRRCTVDREATIEDVNRLRELFDGILEVSIRGSYAWTHGLTWQAIRLVGLEGLMTSMIDRPGDIHRLMAFLRDDDLAVGRWLEREGLLTLNDENDYIGSGSLGYTRELPAEGYCPDRPARLKDLWVLSESQETVGVSPAMFAEFIYPYQRPVMESYGLTYYGCCEPVHQRWSILAETANLRRVSVSPWCDQHFMAGALGRDYIFCRKPNPTLVSTARFDEDAILADLRETLTIAREEGCLNVELVLKDVHTVNNEPQRLRRWVQRARQAVDEVWA